MRPTPRRNRLIALFALLIVGACSAPSSKRPPVELTVPVVTRPTIVAERVTDEMNKAIALVLEKNYPQAEANLEEIIKIRGDIPEAYFNLAWVKQSLGKHQEVPAHIAAGLKLRPNEISALLLQALSEREMGKFSDAEATYLKAMAIAPHDDRLQLNLGILYDLYLFRPKEAVDHYRRYQALQKTPDMKVEGWITALDRISAAKKPTESSEATSAGDTRQ